MLLVNDTLPFGARPQLSPQLKLPRSTYRYSAFTLTLLTKPTSRPAPTVQPALLMLPPGKPGRVALMSPNARPPVRQEAVESITHPPARSGKPLVAGLATGCAQHSRRPFEPDQSMSPSAP